MLLWALLLGLLPAVGARAELAPIIALATRDSVTIKPVSPDGWREAKPLRYEIRHWPDGESLAAGSFDAKATVKGDLAGPILKIDGLKPKLWMPADPQLYEIVLTTDGGREFARTRFGFRTFEIRDRRFYLNGRPIFLRCNPINPPGRELPDATGKNRAFIRGYLRLMKDAGVNMVRTDTPAWLDACDELGMLVFQGRYGPTPGQVEDTPPAVEAAWPTFRKAFCALASHPSVVIYVLSNEVKYGAFGDFLTATREKLRELDPTRPVIGNAGFGKGQGGEIYDIHPYLGWYWGNACDWYQLSDALAQADAAGKPLTVSECVAAYTCDSGEFLTLGKQLSNMIRWSGPEIDQKTAALDYQAEVVRQVVETARRLRTDKTGVAGVMPFTYFLGWTKATKASDLSVKPAFEALRVGFQPVLISPECWKRNLYAGDSLEMRLCVANDDDSGRDLAPSTAEVEVVAPDGRAIAKGQAAFTAIRYYANAWADLSIPIPVDTAKGDYSVRVRLIENGGEISGNKFEVTIAPRSWPKVAGVQVSLYDPAGTTASALRELGVEATPISGLDRLPQTGLVVIGEKALTKSNPPQLASIQRFLENGGRILCLRQDYDEWTGDWLPTKIEMPARGSFTYLHPVGGNEAIFRDLRSRDLRYWNELGRAPNGTPDVCPVPTAFRIGDAAVLKTVRAWALCDRALNSTPLVEVSHGKGSALLSQFRCAERVHGDPLAAKLLANLVSYAASGEVAKPVDLSEPVTWDLAAIRRGIFASITQGFLPHSKTYRHRGSSKGESGSDHRIDGFTLVGKYGFDVNGWIVPIPDPAAEGWGVCYGALSRPATRFGVKLRSVSKSRAKIIAKLDGKPIGRAAVVAPGAEKTVEWKIQRQPGPVELELRGDQRLVVLESWFR